MYFHPARMTFEGQQRIVRWLEANGCRHLIAFEPIVVKGCIVEYVAMCRKDAKSVSRIRAVDGELILLGVRRLRIRIPLSAVA